MQLDQSISKIEPTIQKTDVFLASHYHLRNPLVAPVTMNKKQPLKKTKLGNRKIASHHGLPQTEQS